MYISRFFENRMDFISEKAREKFFILGRKLGWLDASLDRKINAVSLEPLLMPCANSEIASPFYWHLHLLHNFS